MDTGTAKEEIRARLQELSADFWTAAEVLRAINEGVNRFSQEERWPWLYTLTEGVPLAAEEDTLELETGVAFERHFDLMLLFADDTRPRMPRRVSPMEGYQLRQRFYNPVTEPIAYYLVSQSRSGQDEVQTLVNAGTTVGTFTITFDGQTTAVIARGASAATIEAELKALSNVGPADVKVTGGPLGTDTISIRFQRNLGAANVPQITLGGTTANLTVNTLVAGATPSAEYVPTIRLIPALTRAATFEYQYIRDPATAVVDADVLDIPDEYAMGVVAYATGHLFLKELQWSQKADEQFALYRKSVDDAKRQLRRLPFDKDFAWGRNEPEFGYMSDAAFVELVTPQELGP